LGCVAAYTGHGPFGFATGAKLPKTSKTTPNNTRVRIFSIFSFILFRIFFSFREGGRRARNDRKVYFRASTAKTICNLPPTGGTSAGESFSRELASRSLSPIKPLPASYASHFSAYFLLEIRQSSTTAFNLGPWKPAQVNGQNAQGRESRYCVKFYRQYRGTRSKDERI
jgi:hypothetical protein